MSKSVDSKSISQIAKEILPSWEERYNNLYKELQEKEEEIKKLKEALNKAMIFSPINDEEEIALSQIQKLRDISRTRTLTLEEVKILDYLVKNKRLAQEQVTTIKGVKSVASGKSKNDLIKIVSPAKKEKNNE